MTKDEVFEVLSSSRRRLILYHLYRRGGEAELRELAEDTAEAEREGEAVDDDVIKRFYISLYQTHVPKLEEVGLVRHDGDANTVSLTDRAEEIEGVLKTESEPGRQWSIYYGALALLGTALAVGQVAGALPPETSIVFAATVLLLAAFQYYETEVKRPDYHFLEQLIEE